VPLPNSAAAPAATPKRTASHIGSPREEGQNNTGQHAVPSTNGATRLDRDCGKALAYFRCRQKRALTTQREDDNLTAVLLDELLDCLLFIALGTDLPSRQVGELAQARPQPR
jgi:hypothetical protein